MTIWLCNVVRVVTSYYRHPVKWPRFLYVGCMNGMSLIYFGRAEAAWCFEDGGHRALRLLSSNDDRIFVLQDPTGEWRASALATPPKTLRRGHGSNVVATDRADMAFLRRSMLPKHEHGLPALFVKLLEQNEGSLIKA